MGEGIGGGGGGGGGGGDHHHHHHHRDDDNNNNNNNNADARSGEHHLDMQENIHKTRIVQGLPAGDAMPHKLGKFNPFQEDSFDGR